MDYDLVVIGSGPAGEKGAAQAAWFGKRVAIVEREPERVGGACVNTGTLPSKTLRETALFLSGFRQRALYGVSVELRGGVTVPDLMCRLEPVCGNETERIYRNIERHRIELVRGTARFLDEHTIGVFDPSQAGCEPFRTLSTDVVLIATGSSPNLPAGIPFEDPDVDDSDSILELDRIPKTLVVLGAGVIGCEYASIFAALGVKVTLIEKGDRLLGFLDGEMAELLARQLIELGVEILFDTEATRIERRNGAVRIRLKNEKELVTERLLCAAGRVGNTAALGLEHINVAPNSRRLLSVDEHYRVPGPRDGRVYAAGDVIGFPALASTAMEQARVGVCHAFGFRYKTRVSEHLPYGLYTIPEASMVGLTEEAAAKAGIDYTVGRARYRDVARGQIVGDLDGLLKLVFRTEDKRLLGVHVLGERATELIHVGQMVIHFGGAIDDLVDEVWNYPTLSELYKIAAYDGLGNLARRRALESASG